MKVSAFLKFLKEYRLF